MSVENYKVLTTDTSIDTILTVENERKRTEKQKLIEKNRELIKLIFSIIKMFGKLSLPLRGHDESKDSLNKGVFREFVEYLAKNGDTILADHLFTSGKNATYLSPMIQNEMIIIVGNSIRDYILKEVIISGPFSILMDETSDLSHKEQVSIFVRYIKHDNNTNIYTICEHMMALKETTETTGEALTSLLLNIFDMYKLDIRKLVGQGYDGGSNMKGATKGVQSRIKEINPNSLYTHCFAHNLNLVLVNSLTGKEHKEARNCFGIVELMYTHIEGSPARHSYFMDRQKEYNSGKTSLHFVSLSNT